MTNNQIITKATQVVGLCAYLVLTAHLLWMHTSPSTSSLHAAAAMWALAVVMNHQARMHTYVPFVVAFILSAIAAAIGLVVVYEAPGAMLGMWLAPAVANQWIVVVGDDAETKTPSPK